MPNPALDRAARQMGFKDYATYSAYQAHQAMMRQGPANVGVGTTGSPQAPAAQPAAPPQNWLQRLLWGLGGGK